MSRLDDDSAKALLLMASSNTSKRERYWASAAPETISAPVEATQCKTYALFKETTERGKNHTNLEGHFAAQTLRLEAVQLLLQRFDLSNQGGALAVLVLIAARGCLFARGQLDLLFLNCLCRRHLVKTNFEQKSRLIQTCWSSFTCLR
jgi:hypothetical protein